MGSAMELTGSSAESDRMLLDARSLTLVVSGVLAVVLVSLVSMLPVPYALMSPGPIRDVLSGTGEHQLIQIEGHQTYPTDGSLDLLTVQVSGGPGAGASVWQLLGAWADPTVEARPIAEVYPPDVTAEEVEQENTAEMVSSQEAATAAALTELGIDVTYRLEVGAIQDDVPAAQALQPGDTIRSVDGRPVVSLTELADQLTAMPAGQQVEVEIDRDGQTSTVRFATSSVTEDDGSTRTVLGITPASRYSFPFDVQIRIDDIGGPSAGMIFALGIVDKLTPGAMTGGSRVAGTGTMSADGRVGAIGGIRQKMYAAVDEGGVNYFLAPADNCVDVAGHVPAGLQVISVSTLSQARDAVETIGRGDAQAISALPACAAN
ncbi:MAG: PDZ domain-containing protein [Actinomycetales bacterium]